MVASRRLDLVPLGHDVLVASLTGGAPAAQELVDFRLPVDWPEGHEHLLTLRRDQLEAEPSVLPWLARASVERASRTMVGHVGFHAPPVETGMIEIGYTTEPGFRRRGFAREAVIALVGWAVTQPGVRVLRGSVSPDNAASVALLTGLGLTRVGSLLDEIDGMEDLYEVTLGRDWPTAVPLDGGLA